MDKVEFTIKNKPITFKISVAFTVTSVAIALMMILIIVAFKIYLKVNLIWFIEVFPTAALTASVLGLFAYYKEEFSLKDGEFRYIKLFKKAVVIKAETVACVYMRPFGQKTKIEFIHKNGRSIATVFDDGTMLQDGIFLNALGKLEIPTERNGYGDE